LNHQDTTNTKLKNCGQTGSAHLDTAPVAAGIFACRRTGLPARLIMPFGAEVIGNTGRHTDWRYLFRTAGCRTLRQAGMPDATQSGAVSRCARGNGINILTIASTHLNNQFSRPGGKQAVIEKNRTMNQK